MAQGSKRDASEEPLTRYHKKLFLLLCGATIFEGFDTMLTSLSLHYLGKEFGAEPATLAAAISWISTGTVAAFATLALFNLAAVPLIWWLLPESRALSLDDGVAPAPREPSRQLAS